MALIRIVVFRAFQEDINLVANDYYQQEIEFQNQMDAISNAQNLPTPINMLIDRTAMAAAFEFPGSLPVEGEIHFFRPSDNTLDQKIAIKLDSGMTQAISIGHLRRGLWKVKIKWHDGTKEYFEEKVLVI